VWLTVRIVNRRERWAKWTAIGIVVALPLLYVASFGPACWIRAASLNRQATIPSIYLPLGRATTMMPGWFGDAMFAYARFGMPPSTRVFIPFERHAYWQVLAKDD
jgi:hypothetical protein